MVSYTMLPSKGLKGEELLIHDQRNSESEPEGECFLAFTRVFSGILCAG
jgi:ribosome assembly protein 1